LDSLLALLDHNDLIKIRLVRALLALPEVLVLDEVGDDMSVQDLQEMHKVLVAYLEYKIPGVDDTETCKLLRKVVNVPRTIIWSGFKRTLQPYVDAKNFMLVVKDSSKIIFTAPDGAW
jgi:DNA-binding NarL/FixJ family response regulator